MVIGKKDLADLAGTKDIRADKITEGIYKSRRNMRLIMGKNYLLKIGKFKAHVSQRAAVKFENISEAALSLAQDELHKDPKAGIRASMYLAAAAELLEEKKKGK